MTKEQMMDEVIRRRGFEDHWTVWFCTVAESPFETADTLWDAYLTALHAKC